MSNLLLSTLAMMGLTFIIGFFVAGIIKTIANWADLLNLYKSHKKEILVLKREPRTHFGGTKDSMPEQKKTHGRLTHKLNDTLNGLYTNKKSVTA